MTVDLNKPVFQIDNMGHAYKLLDTRCGAPSAAEADKHYSNRIPCTACRNK
jgi:hypothetical protein